MKKSPFIIEDAVPPDKFFDRKRELELLKMFLDSGKRKMLICIVAPLKYGKTSLMLKYVEILTQYDDIIPIYINLKESVRLIEILARKLCEVLDSSLLEAFEKARIEDDPLIFFEAVDSALKRYDKHLFILFDEFHLLPSRVKAEGFLTKFSDEDIFGFFRGYAERRRISYIVCGSVIEPLLNAIDVWGGRFWVIYLGPFSREDAVEMLKKLFKEGGMSVSEEVIEEIAESAGYHPFYMQFLGNYLFSRGEVNRRTLIEAKRELIEYLSTIFDEYIRRVSSLGKDYARVLIKVAKGEKISFDERMLAIDLVRKGFLRKKNTKYEVIDPLFKRYLEAFELTDEPPDVLVVGHWAERIVGNYLLKKGYYPFYSHDSKGAFDIYVKVGEKDVGIQVKYSSSGVVRISKSEAERLLEASKEMRWIPLIALVSKDVTFFSAREGELKESEGFKDIEEAINEAEILLEM